MYNHHAQTVFLILSISFTNVIMIKHELKVYTFTPRDNVVVINGDRNAIN